jgi:hypothetical protein
VPKSPRKKPRNPLHYLTTEEVRAVRRRGKKGESTAALAVEFKVHRTTIQNILAGRTRLKG